METLNNTFANIAIRRSELEELQSNYSQGLVSLRDSLNGTLQKCGLPCSRVSLEGLTFSSNFSTVRRGSVWVRGPLPQPPQLPHPRLFPTDPRCGAAAAGTA